jgi:hypothetical protein
MRPDAAVLLLHSEQPGLAPRHKTCHPSLRANEESMSKKRPLVENIYFLPEYIAVARAIGYRGVVYRDLWPIIEDLGKQFGKTKVESAIYHLTTFEGQMTCNPPPLAMVRFRENVRPLMWQLLGPAPEQKDAFRHALADEPGEKLNEEPVSTEKMNEVPPEPPRKTGNSPGKGR